MRSGCERSRGECCRVLAPVALLLAALSGPSARLGAQQATTSAPAAARPALRLRSTEAVPVERMIPLSSPGGRTVGAWELTEGGVRLHPSRPGAVSVAGPPLQRWLASSDGRTLVGAGDRSTHEWPITLEIVVFRDGRRLPALDLAFAPEAEVTVGTDGSVAVVGSLAESEGPPLALVLDPQGELLYRHELAPDVLARDPVLFDGGLLVRAHSGHDERAPARILRVDADGAQPVLEALTALSLVGFPAERRAALVTREELVFLDADGRVLWRRAGHLRPAGSSAWATWSSGAGELLAVVTAELRRGERATAPAATLLLIDARDGALVASHASIPVGPMGAVELVASADDLVVLWRGARETYTWTR
jgi:hypothetical protein